MDDSQVPTVVAVSPPNGTDTVPLNALVEVRFDEPMNIIPLLTGLTVEVDGQPVPGMIAISDGNRKLTFTSASAFESNTVHTITIADDLTDLAGNSLGSLPSLSFTTSDAGDVVSPRITDIDPRSNATDVPTNVIIRVSFDERINPATVTPTSLMGSFFVTTVPGTVAVAPDLRSATYTPDAPLAPHTGYGFTVNGSHTITDFSGQALLFTQQSFTTDAGPDSTNPTVVSLSPPNGATGVPVNGQVVVQLSEPIAVAQLPTTVIQVSNGGVVPGSLSISTDRQLLTFTPDAPMAVSTPYTIQVSGLVDHAGNALVPVNSSFTTSGSATADTTRPSLLTIIPANDATNVPVDTTITYTFDEVLDPTSVNETSLPVRLDGLSGNVAGSYAVSGETVIFTPLTPLPGGVTVRPQGGGLVRDLAGNSGNGISTTFTTAATADVTPPAVTLITPSNGATDVPVRIPVVLTFSESLNASTITNETFFLFANGTQLSIGNPTRSADNRTVTLTRTFPESSTIEVVITNGVTDLSGNVLPEFRSQFTTGLSEATQPQVMTQRPAHGAMDVPVDKPLVFFTTEPLDASTVPGALFISQNGVLIDGTTTVTGSGRTITFTPDVPWAPEALIQIFFEATARDLAGNPLRAYEAFFRTAADPMTLPPQIIRSNPGVTNTVPLNVVLEVEVSEALAPATVTPSTAFLREDGGSNLVIPTTLTLEGDGRLIRLVPQSLLLPAKSYLLEVTTDVQDLQGDALPTLFQRAFSTGTDTDSTLPQVVRISPPEGAQNVGVNAAIQLTFDEAINPLSVTDQTVQIVADAVGLVACTVTFDSSNQEVELITQEPLPDNTLITVTVDGVTDPAGNALATAQQQQFTTGTGPDFERPEALHLSPAHNALDVPVNTVIVVEVNEPIDARTVTTETFTLRDNFTNTLLPGTVGVSPNSQRITFVPNVPLGVGRRHSVSLSTSEILDVVGNTLTGTTSASFTTAFVGDTTPPQILAISPPDGFSNIPQNTEIVVRFAEPIQAVDSDLIIIQAGGQAIPVLYSLTDGNREVHVQPLLPLQANTVHTIEVGMVHDLAGNVLTPVMTTFTTGTAIDVIRPRITDIDPRSNATDVPTNVIIRVSFDERINPATVTPLSLVGSTFAFTHPGTVAVAPDLRSATYTPDAPLAPHTSYRLLVSNSARIMDFSGQTASLSQPSFITGAGPDSTNPTVVSLSPPKGATSVPVNGQVVVQLSEPIAVAQLPTTVIQVSNGGVVPGSLSISTDRQLLTFTPDAPMAVSTPYTIQVSGLVDHAGNALVPVNSSFTTSGSATADTTRPSLLTIIPANDATNVPVDTTITYTFDEVLDPTSVNETSLPVRLDGLSGNVAGSYAVSGETVIFTPLTPLPGGVTVRPQGGGLVRDLAGNSGNGISTTFTTAATADVTPPAVTLITPSNGATDVPVRIPVVLTFSESLNASTITNETFFLFANGTQLSIGNPTRSADNRTVTLTRTFPESSTIEVVITNGVTDLSGNVLPEFRSQFTTGLSEATQPQVMTQRPAHGAMDVPVDKPLVFFTTEPLDASTVPGALFISQNGVLIDGTTTVTGSGRTITFTPDVPWAPEALIQIFFEATARDLAGNPLRAYEAFFPHRRRSDDVAAANHTQQSRSHKHCATECGLGGGSLRSG